MKPATFPHAAALAAFAAGVLVSCGAVRLMPVPDGGTGDGGVTLPDGGSDAGLPPADAGLPLQAACDVLIHARCAYLERCGLVSGEADDAQACRKRLEATWCGPTTWPARVDAKVGTLKYDAKLAQDCADAFASRACAEYDGEPGSCGAFLKPGANARQACYGDYPECIEGVCRGAACPRACLPRGVSGEVCREDSDCAARLFCRRSTTTPGVGTCTLYAGIDDGCDEATRCLDGLWCYMGQCRQLPPSGQQCLYGRCDELAFCDPALDGGTCLTRKNRGAGCLPGQCLPDLVCGALTGVCEPRVLDQPGAPCTWEQACPAGLVCRGWTTNAPGTCEAPAVEGAACERHGDCQAHLACLAEDAGLTCQRRLGPGARCADARACGLLSACAQGECRPLREPGQACDETKACLLGPCVDTGASGFKCAEPLGPGGDCQAGADCASGQCEAGKCLASCAP